VDAPPYEAALQLRCVCAVVLPKSRSVPSPMAMWRYVERAPRVGRGRPSSRYRAPTAVVSTASRCRAVVCASWSPETRLELMRMSEQLPPESCWRGERSDGVCHTEKSRVSEQSPAATEECRQLRVADRALQLRQSSNRTPGGTKKTRVPHGPPCPLRSSGAGVNRSVDDNHYQVLSTVPLMTTA
jgi:hypothetical protein